MGKAPKALQPHVIIVGAGIMGASLAYHLARQGAAVTIFDKANPAGGATGKAFGWINISSGASGAYSCLRQKAVEDWRRLEHELSGAIRVNWCGALCWHHDQAATECFAVERAAEGYDVRLVGRSEAASIEPGLAAPPAYAVYAPIEGTVDPQAATEALLGRALRAGVTVHSRSQVIALALTGHRVSGVCTDEGVIRADMVVVAAGVGTAKLCRSIGLAMAVNHSPAILLRVRTNGCLVNGIVSAPDMEVRQASCSLLVAAADYIDESAEHGPARVAFDALGAIRSHFRGGGDAMLESVAVGVRPMPADCLPVVGPVPGVDGLYLAVTHSGVTMAPIIGRLAAEEILGQPNMDLLAFCRAGRFALSNVEAAPS